MNVLNRLVLGAIGGVVATGPMTAAMILLHRRLPIGERYPLPPREITMKLAEKAGVDEELSKPTRTAATLVSHFGYGAAAGALYTAALDPRDAPFAKGLLCGLFVWSASYLGLLPAAGILSSATEHPGRRNALMIGAHLVWGVTLGAFVKLLAEENETVAPPPFSASPAPHRDAR
jgi:putative membrane protein